MDSQTALENSTCLSSAGSPNGVLLGCAYFEEAGGRGARSRPESPRSDGPPGALDCPNNVLPKSGASSASSPPDAETRLPQARRAPLIHNNCLVHMSSCTN